MAFTMNVPEMVVLETKIIVLKKKMERGESVIITLGRHIILYEGI
jgi:hypothetical protein